MLTTDKQEADVYFSSLVQLWLVKGSVKLALWFWKFAQLQLCVA